MGVIDEDDKVKSSGRKEVTYPENNQIHDVETAFNNGKKREGRYYGTNGKIGISQQASEGRLRKASLSQRGNEGAQENGYARADNKKTERPVSGRTIDRKEEDEVPL